MQSLTMEIRTPIVPGHCACLKSISRAITVQSFKMEIQTLMLPVNTELGVCGGVEHSRRGERKRFKPAIL